MNSRFAEPCFCPL